MNTRHRSTYRNSDPRERSVARLLINLVALIIVVGGAIMTWLFLSDRDLLFSTPNRAANADAPPALARYVFDTAELVAPTRLVTRIDKRTLGNVRKLDLLLPWPYQPGTVPALPATAREFDDWLILTFETTTEEQLSAEERYGEIYPVYFDGEPEQVSGNLLRYKFRQDSPYSDLTLYVANADSKQIIHRCDLKPSVLGPILCERAFKLAGNITLRLRFASKHLENWADIEKNVRLALANMYRATQ